MSGEPSASPVVGAAGGSEEKLWPALQPSAPLNSLLSARDRDGGPNNEDTRHDDRTGSSTDRVNQAVGLAFDRLWRDRPGIPSAPSDAATDAAGSPTAGGTDRATVSEADAKRLLTIDGFITNYFRHVAELSRESVYQAHQREILHRMREDFIAGERSGNMRELEEMIQRVDLDDRSLQAEIASLMRIADAGSRSNCPVNVCRCMPSCLGDDQYPPVITAHSAYPASQLAGAAGVSDGVIPTAASNGVSPSASGAVSPSTAGRAAAVGILQSGTGASAATDSVGDGGKDVPPCISQCVAQ